MKNRTERSEATIRELLKAGAKKYGVSYRELEAVHHQLKSKPWDEKALMNAFGEKVVSAYFKILGMGKGNTYSDLRAAITDAESTTPKYYQPSGLRGGTINGEIRQ